MALSTIKKKLRKDTAWALILRVLTAISALAINVIVARLLDPEDVATYFLITSMVSMLAFGGSFGLHIAVVRFVAEALGLSQEGRARQAIGKVMLLSVASSMVMFLLIWGGGMRLINDLFYQSETLAKSTVLVAGWVFVWAVQMNYAEIFRGFNDIRLAVTFRRLGPNALYLVALVAFYFVWPSIGLMAVLWAGLAAWALCLLICWAITARLVAPLNHEGNIGYREILQASWPLGVTTTLSFAMTQMDIWILGALAVMNDLALYGSAAKLTRFVIFPLFILNATLPPLFSSLYAKGEHAELEELLRRSSTWAALFGAITLGVSLVFGRQALGLIYGDFYADGSAYLQLLLVGLFFRLLGGASQMALMMTGNERVTMVLSFMSTAILVVGGIIGGKFYGGMGVAWAVVAGQVFQNICYMYYVQKRLGVSALPDFRVFGRLYQRR
ncbi:MAG: oligosaccharide flippase family protein [Proteobacteria bacterium]|nr:oligosaccharide flippase family protein [Pseudomonadota bacterium]